MISKEEFTMIDTLKEQDIQISMDSKGRATDNIAIERFSEKVCFATAIRYFWRSVKTERIYLNDYKNIKELKDDINSYINFYNYYRFHQTLKYKKPMEVYNETKFLNFFKQNIDIHQTNVWLKIA